MRGITRFGVWAIAALALAQTIVDADDAETPAQAAWRERLDGQLTRLEMTVAALDRAKPPVGLLLARVTALQKRLAALERAAKLDVGVIRGVDDLSSLTMDVTSMGTRAKAVIDARAPKKAPPPETPPSKPGSDGGGAPPPPPPPPEPPAPPASPATDPQKPPRTWPERLEFSATAKITYQETGEWFLSKNQRSGLGNDFLMDGYSGTVAFSLRAKGLKKEIVSADIRVAVKLKAPFAYDDNTFRIYDVQWTSEIAQSGRFGNDSLKHYPRYATVACPGPIEWIREPKQVSTALSVHAHVRSVTLAGGEVIEFDVPDFVPKR